MKIFPAEEAPTFEQLCSMTVDEEYDSVTHNDYFVIVGWSGTDSDIIAVYGIDGSFRTRITIEKVSKMLRPQIELVRLLSLRNTNSLFMAIVYSFKLILQDDKVVVSLRTRYKLRILVYEVQPLMSKDAAGIAGQSKTCTLQGSFLS